VVCNAPERCQTDGTCDALTGQCVYKTCAEAGQCCNDQGVCEECPPEICPALPCTDQPTCTVHDPTCVCLGLTGQTSGVCGTCITDGKPADSAAECCSGDFCATQGLCGLCPPQVCAGTCASSPLICATHAPDCICSSATLGCQTCVTVGGVCRASDECCGNEVCVNGVCGFRKARRGRGCTKHGQACRADGQCCGQANCYQGRCGEKDTHCHHDGECARGYRCEGGRSIGSHRRCRKTGSKKNRRKI
jgi:hypothetical protein